MVCVGGKYQLLGKLGSGGTSSVYLAVDTVLHKQWAVKETSAEHLDSDKNDLILQSLRAEVEVLNHCNHPCIPRIVDFFKENGRAYAVRDYVEGCSLKTIIEQSGVISPSQVCVLGIKLCDLLQYLHSLKPAVIYCDLKPSNVMVSGDSSVHLIDFGSALELKNEDGVLVQPSRFKQDARFATQGFAAPELFEQGAKIGVFTDVYALGATLFYALTGRCYLEGFKDLGQARLGQVRLGQSHPLTNFDLTKSDSASGVNAVLMRALANNPKDRYEDCAEFAQALKDCLEDLESGVKIKSNTEESGLVLRKRGRAKGGKQNVGKRRKKNGVQSGKKNIVKIACCALMALIGCVVFVFACKSVITVKSKQTQSQKSAYVKNGNIAAKNKNASATIRRAQEYKQYMVKAAKSTDSKQVVEYLSLIHI